MDRAQTYRRRPILDLLKSKGQSSDYETSIPSKRRELYICSHNIDKTYLLTAT